MWRITKDVIGHGEMVGVSSFDCSKENTAELKHPFRLLDGDRIVYYEGVSDDCESGDAFAPLDDFGEGYAGCGFIEYLESSGWKQL